MNDDTNKVEKEPGWLERCDNALFARLNEEDDPQKVRQIIETIACSHTNISLDGTRHTNSVDPVVVQRIMNSRSPVIIDYRNRLGHWGVNPDCYPLVPFFEWACEAVAPSET